MKHLNAFPLLLSAALMCAVAIPQARAATPIAPQATKSNYRRPLKDAKKDTHRVYNKSREGSHAAADRTKEGGMVAADRTKEGVQGTYAPRKAQHTKARDNAHIRATKRHDRRSEHRQKAHDQATTPR